MADLSDLTKSRYFPEHSNSLSCFAHDIANNRWLCPRCGGVVITSAEVWAAATPEALSFIVANAERRHKLAAHP